MNYDNKDRLYKVENIIIKYLNYTYAGAMKLVRQILLTRCYETKTTEWKKYSKTKKTRFLFIHTGIPNAEKLSSENRLGPV
jgi:hypothetical protein